MSGELGRQPVLDSAACARAVAAVHSLREHWAQRFPEVPFFTLGTPAYLDGLNGFAAYRARVELTTPLLEEHFGWLLARVAAALAERVAAPCRLAPGLARPGFHIYLSSPGFTKAGSRHFDLQHEQVEWNGQRVDLDRQLSFTLPLRLPRQGGGLLVWPLDHRELRRLSPQSRREALAAAGEPTLHAYREGELVSHSGSLLHQIAPLPDMEADDQRITLQGHAVAAEDGWLLYW